jgi:hypothetical protein
VAPLRRRQRVTTAAGGGARADAARPSAVRRVTRAQRREGEAARSRLAARGTSMRSSLPCGEMAAHSEATRTRHAGGRKVENAAAVAPAVVVAPIPDDDQEGYVSSHPPPERRHFAAGSA